MSSTTKLSSSFYGLFICHSRQRLLIINNNNNNSAKFTIPLLNFSNNNHLKRNGNL